MNSHNDERMYYANILGTHSFLTQKLEKQKFNILM